MQVGVAHATKQDVNPYVVGPRLAPLNSPTCQIGRGASSGIGSGGVASRGGRVGFLFCCGAPGDVVHVNAPIEKVSRTLDVQRCDHPRTVERALIRPELLTDFGPDTAGQDAASPPRSHLSYRSSVFGASAGLTYRVSGGPMPVICTSTGSLRVRASGSRRMAPSTRSRAGGVSTR